MSGMDPHMISWNLRWVWIGLVGLSKWIVLGCGSVTVRLRDAIEARTMLPGPRRRTLRHCYRLEHASPQLEAPTLISKVLTFMVQDALHL
jgi:hypothetical protein